MTKTISVSLGKCNFVLNEDAYELLNHFLKDYRQGLGRTETPSSADEITEEVELRIAELLRESLQGREVVDSAMIRKAVTDMGFSIPINPVPDFTESGQPVRKLYRDTDHKVLGGVCSGLALYSGLDVILIRVLFTLAFILGLAGLWAYLVFWIIVPAAKTPVEKCGMHGEAATPDNINRYSAS